MYAFSTYTIKVSASAKGARPIKGYEPIIDSAIFGPKDVQKSKTYYIEDGYKLVVEEDLSATTMTDLVKRASVFGRILGTDILMDGYLYYEDESSEYMMFHITANERGEAEWKVGR